MSVVRETSDDRALQVLSRYLRLLQVRDDHDVRAQLTRDIDGQVAGHAAVSQHLAVLHHRRERTGNRHARPHRSRQIAGPSTTMSPVTMSVATARNGIGRPLEATLQARARDVVAQQVIDSRSADHATGRDDLAVLQSEFQVIAVGDAGALLLDRHQFPNTRIADHGLPVDAAEELLQFGRRNSRGVAGADQRTHAGAGDAVDGDAQLLQHLQHADVRPTPGAATRKHQANARTLRGWRLLRGGNTDNTEAAGQQRCCAQSQGPCDRLHVQDASSHGNWSGRIEGIRQAYTALSGGPIS